MPKKSWYGVTGSVYSHQWKTFLPHSSYLEREIYIWLDTDPRVVRFQPEPMTIHYLDAEGASRSYTPDVLVHYCELSYAVLAEIKWKRDLRDQHRENLPKFLAATQFALKNGMRFTVFTEKKVANHEYRNRKFLRRYINEPQVANADQQKRILAGLTAAGPTTIDSLLHRLSKDPDEQLVLLPTLWHLIAIGKIKPDLSNPFGRRSRIYQ